MVETFYDTVCIPMIEYDGEGWAKSMTKKSREEESQCAASGDTPHTDSRLSRSGSWSYALGLSRLP